MVVGKDILTLDKLKTGQKVEGCVTNVTHFGAFVDIGLGGPDGLLHKSKFKGQDIKLGQRLDVAIKSIVQQRIELELCQ